MVKVETVGLKDLSQYQWLLKVTDLLGEVTIKVMPGGAIRIGTAHRIYSPIMEAADLDGFCRKNLERYRGFADAHQVEFEVYRESRHSGALPVLEPFWE